ncbi:ParM/StbA family protein [Candidatus Woesebacteria bacterium]|nr:ParM/StbA family protein [Candidatus Woesebacteria bacterium]
MTKRKTVSEETHSKDVHIVSIDAGNGMTNAILAKPNGGYKRVNFPSVRATATGDSLGIGKQFEVSYDFVDWGSHRYMYGDDAIAYARRGLERHQGAFRYGDEFHRFLIAVAIGKLGITEGQVDLTMFAPPGMFTEVKRTIKKRFAEAGGKVAIKFKRKNAVSWQYSDLTLWPEGIGAAACFALDETGQPANTDMLDGETVILDLGMYTLDALQMSNGNFNPESLQHATWENDGIRANILEPILNVLKKQSADLQLLTTDDVDRVLRNSIMGGDYVLKAGQVEVDLEDMFVKYSQRYAERIANNIVDGVFNGLRGIRSLILVGGGAVLVDDYLRQWFDNKVLDFASAATTSGIHPVDANSIGGIRLAKMRLKQYV